MSSRTPNPFYARPVWGWAIFTLLSLIGMLFLFRGAFWNAEILAPLDIPGTLYSKYGWLESGRTMPANHYTIDVFDHELPRQYLIHSAVQAGEFPWWDPYSDGGRPLAADAHVSGTDPLRLALYRVLPFVTAYNYTKILQSYWMGLGMYLLLGALGYGRWLRVTGALTYQFAANHAFFLTPLSIPAVFVSFPYLFYAWSTYGITKRPAWLLMMVGVVALALLAGNQQTHVLVLLVLFALWIGGVWKDRSPCWKQGLTLGLVFAGGCLLAFPILLAQTELFLMCSRDIAGMATPRKLLTGMFSVAGFFPWALGTFRTIDLSKLVEQSGLGFSMFAGSITALLMLLGIPGAGRGSAREAGLKVAVALIVVYLLMASTPLIYVLYTRCSDMAVLGMVVLAVEGAERLSKGMVIPRLGRLVTRASVGIVALFLVMNVAAVWVVPKVAPALEKRLREREAANISMDVAPALRQAQIKNLAFEISWRNLEMTLAVIGVGLFAWAISKGHAAKGAWPVTLAILNIAPSLLFSERFATRQPIERWTQLLRGGPEQTAAIAAAGPGGRLRERSPGRLEYLFPGVTEMLFRLHTYHGYSSFVLPDLGEVLEKEWPQLKISEASYISKVRGLNAGELTVHPDSHRFSRYQWLGNSDRKVELKEESLNRVVLEVGAGPAGSLVRTDRYFPGWKVVSPSSVSSTVVHRHFLQLEVPSGATSIVLEYKPRFLGPALSVAVLSAVVLAGWGLWQSRRRTT